MTWMRIILPACMKWRSLGLNYSNILWIESYFLFMQKKLWFRDTFILHLLRGRTAIWIHFCGFQGSDSKQSACNVGDLGLIPELGRFPGEGNGNPFQHSWTENSMERGAGGLQPMGLQRVGHDWANNTVGIQIKKIIFDHESYRRKSTGDEIE